MSTGEVYFLCMSVRVVSQEELFMHICVLHYDFVAWPFKFWPCWASVWPLFKFYTSDTSQSLTQLNSSVTWRKVSEETLCKNIDMYFLKLLSVLNENKP